MRSDRVRAAGGPGWALSYHAAYEFAVPLADLPGGVEWQAEVERTPPPERHLAEHGVTDLVFQPAGPDILRELDVFMATVRAEVQV